MLTKIFLSDKIDFFQLFNNLQLVGVISNIMHSTFDALYMQSEKCNEEMCWWKEVCGTASTAACCFLQFSAVHTLLFLWCYTCFSKCFQPLTNYDTQRNGIMCFLFNFTKCTLHSHVGALLFKLHCMLHTSVPNRGAVMWHATTVKSMLYIVLWLSVNYHLITEKLRAAVTIQNK